MTWWNESREGHGGTLDARCLVNEANLKSLYTI